MLENERGVFVEFYTHPVYMKAKSDEAKRQVWEDREHIRIVIPGDKDNVVMRQATRQDKEKYPDAWKRYQEKDKETRVGTPLEEWQPISKSQVKEAKYMEIHTVEQLAAVSDGNLQKLGPGWVSLRSNAQVWVSNQRDGAAAAQVASQLEQANSLIAQLQERMAAMEAQPKPERAKPGPKPKTEGSQE